MEGTLRQTAAAAEATAVATAAALRSILPLQSLGSYTGSAKEKKPTPAFTSWPEGAKGNRVQDLEVDLPVDTLFEVLWAPNASVAVSREEAATLMRSSMNIPLLSARFKNSQFSQAHHYNALQP